VELFPDPDDTIEGVSQALRTGRTSCVEVTRACLATIDERDAETRAWACLDRDGALVQAEELDLDLAQRHWHGFLHGIPIGIKDIIDVAGVPTRAGAPFTDERPARSDATLVARLRAAGAVVLGKTVSTQFACFDPAETRNPWNFDRTPGGSSSGSAAALASGMCLGAIGTQTGGSITRPAAYCGVAGCKPTFRHVSSFGVWPLAYSLDHPGPMARTVSDLAIMLDIMAGYDRRDPRSAREPPPTVLAALEEDTLYPPLLGRLRGPFEERADPVVREAFEGILELFRRRGARIVEVRLPTQFEALYDCHRMIMAVEAAAIHEERFAGHHDEYAPTVRQLIVEGLSTPATHYVRCRHHQAELRREMRLLMDDVEILVSPAAPAPAPDRSTTGDPVFNAPWSYVGFPTVSFPMGLSPEGLPLGIQFAGREFGEAALFRAAAWCEREIRRQHGV
jgi:Asp-tRNA(Asn)/Glu-tRNA(Gln) amidotransferase A subunit family amidase